MKYAWIEEQRDVFTVTRMCRLLDVSRTGYSQWRLRPPSERALSNAGLDARVAAIHAGSRHSYGRPRVRIVRELNDQGIQVGHDRVRRSLARQGLRPVYKRPYRVTTDSANLAASSLNSAVYCRFGTASSLPIVPSVNQNITCYLMYVKPGQGHTLDAAARASLT